MYSLDINFLNDRPELKPDKRRSTTAKRAISPDDRRPLFIGFAVLIFLPVLSGAAWGVLTHLTGDLERQQADLDTQLGNLEAEKKNLASIRAQTKQATDEAQALATVFNQIKPWSAMAQDIRDRLPSSVQLVAIKQQESKEQKSSAQPANSIATPVSGVVQIEGVANSFNDVNDFLLTLQQSNFLRPDQTKVVSAELDGEQTLKLPDIPALKDAGVKPPKLPRKVKFTMQTALSDVPASELVRDLERKGAIGLVTRIEALKERGVIQEAANPSKAATPSAKGETKP